MLKIIKVLTVLFCIMNLTGAETAVRKCGHGELKPLSVQVDSCTEMPCELWRGFSTNIAVQFVSTKNSMSDIKADVDMTTLGIGMPFEVSAERKDVCKNLMFGAYCPMDEGEDATYHLVLDIAEYQPEVPAKVQVSIKDASDDTVLACFILDARITKRHGPLTQ
ncbi:NPC intracellular cholesterol transporter 2-like [Calliphora vicina]|uniref:NPC intracellular cholesterol transporter 2-like n=1 Tax=Calliphora vicina TaxID=7373 RepID=UPI00325A549D